MKDEIKKGLILLVIVLVLLAIVYVVTGSISGNLKSNSKNATDNSVNNDPTYSNMIVLSKVFDMDGTYKVLFYSNKNATESLKSAIELYDSKDQEQVLYKVNYDEALNKRVLSTSDNKEAKSSDEIKVKGVTLITISDKKIVSFVSEENEVLKSLE